MCSGLAAVPIGLPPFFPLAREARAFASERTDALALPPADPFARADLVLASDFTLPPLRPASDFLDGVGSLVIPMRMPTVTQDQPLTLETLALLRGFL